MLFVHDHKQLGNFVQREDNKLLVWRILPRCLEKHYTKQRNLLFILKDVKLL